MGCKKTSSYLVVSINFIYKMDPDIFMTWCNILKRVPNSTIWILRFLAAREMRLCAYATAQGVKQEQVIFTDVATKNEHIRHCSLTDLCLDTGVVLLNLGICPELNALKIVLA